MGPNGVHPIGPRSRPSPFVEKMFELSLPMQNNFKESDTCVSPHCVEL
jgi:hypothetical protein